MIARAIPVLQVVPSLETGGAERMVVHLAEGLSDLGLAAHVVSLFDSVGSDLETSLVHKGIHVWHLGKRRGPDFRIIERLARVIEKVKPRLIHSHLSTIRYVFPTAGRIAGSIPLVHTLHRIAERDSEPGLRWLHRWFYKHGVTPVAVAQEVARSAERIYGLPIVPVIPNGIPVERHADTSRERIVMRQRLAIPELACVFACVARLMEVKNHHALLRAFARAPFTPDVRLLLAGDGHLRGELETLAAQLEISQRVCFMGSVGDIRPVLAAADAFVLASHSEGNPLSVMEAMAAGLPVIAPAVGGLPELVTDGVEGLLVTPSNIDALADAMISVAADPTLRARLSKHARATAQARFDVSAMARSYAHLYRTLAETQ